MKKTLLLFLVLVLLSGCSSSDQSKEGIPCIDVRKKYPEKEIILTDIADVEYVHLSTEYDEYLYKGGSSVSITENTIVVVDDSSGSILFFHRDGKPKSRFNRLGQGPEEYPIFLRNKIVYNETADEVYVDCSFRKSIMVYSSTGKFKRKLPLSDRITSMVEFDDHSLLLYDDQLQNKRQRKGGYSSSQSFDSSFVRISKEDGKVLDYALIPYSDVDLTMRSADGKIAGINLFPRIVKCASGVYLNNPESDTIFHYGKDKTITPVICKTPLANDLDPKIVFWSFSDLGRYQFMSDFTIINQNTQRDNRPKSNYYGRDKRTGEIFTLKISLPDYKGYYVNSLGGRLLGEKIQTLFFLDLYRLKEAYNENRLSGKLKELVATLNEDTDNEVYVLVTFKDVIINE